MQTYLSDGWWQVRPAVNTHTFIKLDSYMTCQFGVRLSHYADKASKAGAGGATNLTVGKQDAIHVLDYALVHLYKDNGAYKTAPRVSGLGTMTCAVPDGGGESHALDWAIRAVFDQ